MSKFDPDPIKISTHRALTETRLCGLLEQAGSITTVDDIKNLIFDGTQKDFNSYIRYFHWMFKRPESTVDIDAAVPVIQDAWNYFPHRFLNGQCPAELLARATRADVIISQLPHMRDIEVDDDKIDDTVLALLLLGLHAHARVWKTHDWVVLDRLHKKGYITDPARKAMSVMLTELGLTEAQHLFKKLFAR